MSVLFSSSSTYPAAIEINGVRLPIKVKRFERAELEAFNRGFHEHVIKRGTLPEDRPEDPAADDAVIDFFVASIESALTLEPGLIEDDGQPVVDGVGFLRVFHARVDVLGAVMVAIYVAQRADSVLRKNLKSPLVSDSGSLESIPASGGDAQGSIAESVESSGTAKVEDATESLSLVALSGEPQAQHDEATAAA